MVAAMLIAALFGIGGMICWAAEKFPAINDLLDRLSDVVLLRGKY